jgi:hypothetical protein
MEGWKYFKAGTCPDCHDASASLYVATLPRETQHIGGHFPPICLGCAKGYSLEVVCKIHRVPLRIKDIRCKLCPK